MLYWIIIFNVEKIITSWIFINGSLIFINLRIDLILLNISSCKYFIWFLIYLHLPNGRRQFNTTTLQKVIVNRNFLDKGRSINIPYLINIWQFNLWPLKVFIDIRSIDGSASMALLSKFFFVQILNTRNVMLRLIVTSLVLNKNIFILQSWILWINWVQIIASTCVLKVGLVLGHFLYWVTFAAYIIFRLVIYVFGVLIDFKRIFSLTLWGLHFLQKYLFHLIIKIIIIKLKEIWIK